MEIILQNRVISGFIAIVLLTMALVATNVHSVILQFFRDRDRARLAVYLGAIILMGALIINTTYRVFGEVIDATQTATAVRPGAE